MAEQVMFIKRDYVAQQSDIQTGDESRFFDNKNSISARVVFRFDETLFEGRYFYYEVVEGMDFPNILMPGGVNASADVITILRERWTLLNDKLNDPVTRLKEKFEIAETVRNRSLSSS